MASSRSLSFVPVEERMQLVQELKNEQQQREEEVLIHSQVRRIKREDEETRERLLKLQLLETRPGVGGFRGQQASPPASRSLSPLRRAGNAIPVGDWA